MDWSLVELQLLQCYTFEMVEKLAVTWLQDLNKYQSPSHLLSQLSHEFITYVCFIIL